MRGNPAPSGVIVWAVWLAAAVPGLLAAQGRTERDDVLGRLKYFYDQRAYPRPKIPPGALQSARARYTAQWPSAIEAQRSQVGVSSAGWTGLGPTSIDEPAYGILQSSGRVTSIAVVGTGTSTIYVGGAQGGVWKTLNGGATWTPLTDNMCSLAVGALAVDPVNPNIVYAGTGEMNFSGDSYYGCGVLRSTDGGTSWAQLGGAVFDTPFGGAMISRIVVDAGTAGSSTSSTVFAATSFGLYRSTSSGGTWASVLGGIVTDLVQDPSNPSTLYAAVGYVYGSAANGVYKSTSGGATWSRLSGFPSSDVGRIQLAISPSLPSTIYAAVQAVSTFGLLGIFKSEDSGATWGEQDASNAACSNQCWYDLAISVDPTTPQVVYFGGVGLYKSTDGGVNFFDISSSIHVDQHAFAFDPTDPSIIFAGNDGGIFKSPDQGQTWLSLNSNLSLAQFYPGISLSPSVVTDILGGTQDNGTLEFTGGPVWTQAFGGDGGFTAINYQDPTTAFFECQWKCGPFRRDGGSGGPIFDKSSGIDPSDRALFIPPLVMDPVSPAVLYFGTHRLYRTVDNGETWLPISPDLTMGSAISAIAPAQSSSQTIYVGTADGNVQLTTDGGATWTPVTTGLPNRYVTDIAVDASNAQLAWVTVSGFGSGHVFQTVNGGGSWQNISSNLIDVPANAIVRIPGTSQMFIGTDLGSFLSVDGGASWVPSTTGLPNVAVFDLAFSAATGNVVAATHGRGMFAYTVATPGVLRGDVSLDGRVSAIDAQGILTGVVGLPLPNGWILAPNGDANCDGAATALDAQIVLSFAVGLNTSQFCVGTVK